MSETIRDVTFRLKIELAEAAMKAPDVRPVVEAQEKVQKAHHETARAAEKSASTHQKEVERIGDILRKDYEKTRAARERTARDIARFEKEAAREAERAARDQERANERAARTAERAAQLQEKAFFKVSGAMTKVMDGALGMAKGLALLSVSNEKDSEKMIRGFIKISAGIEILKSAIGIYKAMSEAIRAATAAQMALNAAQAAGGVASGGAAGLGIGGKLMAGLGPLGVVAGGTALGLGAISIFDKGTREGLGELLGFSDMAGDERAKSAKNLARGEAYNLEQAARRSAHSQQAGLRGDIAARGLNGEAAIDARAAAAREDAAGAGTYEKPEALQRLVDLERQRLDVVRERVQATREAATAANAEYEAARNARQGAEGRFAGMKPGEQRRAIDAANRAKRGEDLSYEDTVLLQRAGGGIQGVDDIVQRNRGRQARAAGFGVFDDLNPEQQLGSQARLNSLVARHEAEAAARIEANATKNIQALEDALLVALTKMTDAIVSRIRSEADRKAAEGSTDGGPGVTASFFQDFGIRATGAFGFDARAAAAKNPRANGP